MVKIKYCHLSRAVIDQEKAEMSELRDGYLYPSTLHVDSMTGSASILVSDKLTGVFYMVSITDVFRNPEK